jgi:parallel beta-helix repeat protein
MNKYLLIIVFLMIRTVVLAVNAKDYGAKGDGIQDDSPFLNIAIAQALLLGEDLFIPAGTYTCNQLGSVKKILIMDQLGVKKIRIYGETGTKITTSIDEGGIFYIYYQSENVIIENIFFENTHGITLKQTNAIQLSGTNKNAIKNITIQNCTFEGFSTAISALGVNGFIIQNNLFQSPKGHDNAQDNSQPAVYIWLADSPDGQCYNVKILNNTADGYSGNDIAQTKTLRPMDGFLYGIGYGVYVNGNITRNFSEEHILLAPHKTNVDSKDSLLITGNKLYQSIPVGSMKNGSLLGMNYGIRADCNNVSISNNDFYDYSNGILIYPFDYPLLTQHDYTVSGNRFYAAQSDPYTVNEAISVQANPLNSASNINVSGNQVTIVGIPGKSTHSIISVYNCKNVTITNNTISGQNIDLKGHLLHGILIENCQGIVNNGNQVTIK